MSDLQNAGVQIGQMNLRIPGEGSESGNRIAERVSQRLANQVPVSLERRLGTLSVRVQQPVGATEGERSDAIAEAIMTVLRKGSPEAKARS